MSELNISELLKKAEDLVHDGYMDAAEKAYIPVQKIEDDNDGYYVYLVAVRDKEDFESKFMKP